MNWEIDQYTVYSIDHYRSTYPEISIIHDSSVFILQGNSFFRAEKRFASSPRGDLLISRALLFRTTCARLPIIKHSGFLRYDWITNLHHHSLTVGNSQTNQKPHCKCWSTSSEPEKFTLPFRCRIFVTEAGAKCALAGKKTAYHFIQNGWRWIWVKFFIIH